VYGYATAGGIDTAYFHDSTGDDTFVGKGDEARLSGAGYYLRAKLFDNVFADASKGGDDVALLYGTLGNDLFESNGTMARLSNSDYALQATNFARVEANGGGGEGDTAVVTDAVLQTDTSSGTSHYGLPGSTAARAVASITDFGQLKVKQTADNSETVVSAKDKIFAALWS
jgi:hypothetical protein